MSSNDAKKKIRRRGNQESEQKLGENLSYPTPVSRKAPEEKEKAKKYSEAIIFEAKVIDLTSQARRSIMYAEGSGLLVKKEKNELKALENLLKKIKNELEVNSKVPNFVKMNYEKIKEMLEECESLAKKISSSTTGKARKLYPWFSPQPHSPFIHQNQRSKDEVLNSVIFTFNHRDAPHRKTGRFKKTSFFSGSGDWGIIAPYNFDFMVAPLVYCVPAKINVAEGKYDFTPLDRIIAKNAEHGFKTDIIVGLKRYYSDWVRRKYGSEIEDMFFHNAKGEFAVHSGPRSKLNIWNEKARKYMFDYVTALGKYYRDNPNVGCYEVCNEPAIVSGTGPAGYSKSAKHAFRRYLERKYVTIQKLNERWGADYDSFQQIVPPDNLMPPKEQRLVPPIYDFQKFRRDSFIDYFDELIKALQKADPNHAVVSQFLVRLKLKGKRVFKGLDFLGLASLDWDILGVHDWPAKPAAVDLAYTYSINRYTNHALWNDEFIWTAREGFSPKFRRATARFFKRREKANSSKNATMMKAVTERNIWRHFAWGKRGLTFFNLDESFPGWNNSLINISSGNKIMKYCTGVIPVVNNKIRRIKHILFATEITDQNIRILYPSTSIMVASPFATSTDHAERFCHWLLTNHYVPFIVPEECVLDGREDMSRCKVMIIPYATHVPSGLSEKLLEWVKNGGVLISLGPIGVYNQYGKRYRNNFMSEAFGKMVKVSKTLTAKYGKGKVIVAPVRNTNELIGYIEREVAALRLVDCDSKDVELLLRNDKEENSYLFVINLKPEKAIETEVWVKGEFNRIVDLCIDGGMPVPGRFELGKTKFTLNQRPGECVFYALK